MEGGTRQLTGESTKHITDKTDSNFSKAGDRWSRLFKVCSFKNSHKTILSHLGTGSSLPPPRIYKLLTTYDHLGQTTTAYCGGFRRSDSCEQSTIAAKEPKAKKPTSTRPDHWGSLMQALSDVCGSTWPLVLPSTQTQLVHWTHIVFQDMHLREDGSKREMLSLDKIPDRFRCVILII